MLRKLGRALSAPIAEHLVTPAPVYLFFEVLRRCNHRCRMCNIWKQQENGLPLDEVRRIFGAPFFRGTQRVILTGGEPTLRLDLADMAAHFVASFPKLAQLCVLTTGYNTSRILDFAGRTLDTIDAQRPDASLVVQVSLDAVGETYNQIRGIDKAWDRSVATLRGLRELAAKRQRLLVMAHSVIQPLNVDELDRLRAFCGELDVPVLFSLPVLSDSYFSNASLAQNLELTPAQVASAQRFLADADAGAAPEARFYYRDLMRMLDGAPRGRRCMMGYYMIHVRYDGVVQPCLNSADLVLGDLTRQSPEEIWYGADAGAKRKTVRRQHCPTCTSACYSDVTGVTEVLSAATDKARRVLGGRRAARKEPAAESIG